MQNKISFFSTHSGAGLADAGARMAFGGGVVEPIGGIEIDEYCVKLHRQNFGDGMRHESILDTAIADLPDFDMLWSSPSCINFSTAKTNAQELELDISIAKKIAQIISKKNPKYFALENVRAYVDAESFSIIYSQLSYMGYNIHYDIYDAADFGVPQNRKRLILRASRDKIASLQQTHSKVDGLWWKPWVGWYEAIADLLPICKDSHLTERQIKALHNKGWAQELLVEGLINTKRFASVRHGCEPSVTIRASSCNPSKLSRAVLVEGKDSPSRDRTIRNPEEPCMTVTANQGGGGRLPKVVLVDGKGNNYGTDYTAIDGEARSFTVTANSDRNISRAVIIERTGYGHDRLPMVREINEPCQTIRSAVGCDEKGGYRSPISALLENATVKALDYRCLARLQSVPDDYVWGESAGRNCKSIGNGVPCLLAKAVVESFFDR